MSTTPRDLTLCLLGCGNLGLAILQTLVNTNSSQSEAKTSDADFPFKRYSVCVRSQASEDKLKEQFHTNKDTVIVTRGDNVTAVQNADIIILAVDPADVASTLQQEGMRDALSSKNKLLISIAAGWTRQDLETVIFGSPTVLNDELHINRAWVLRTLPNIASQVGQSMTAIEISEPAVPEWGLAVADAIFSKIGTAVRIPPSLMDATTAVGGSTPAFFAIICDALIDAAVAVGVPRAMANTMIVQSMLGTATMMKNGLHPSLLRDQGTSPEGCTIGGVMVMEEGAVRGHMGKALREAVTIARQMGKNPHVNDTRQ